MTQKALLQSSGDGTAVPAGYIGYDQRAASSSNSAVGTNNTYWDAESLSFAGKPGKYLVIGQIVWARNAATFTTKFEATAGWSTTAGNSSTGLNIGNTASNYEIPAFTTNWDYFSHPLPPAIVIVDSTGIISINGVASSGTTLYMKAYLFNYTSGTPQYRRLMTAVLLA